MALTRTLAQLRADVRKCADVVGVTDRFPDADVNDYVHRGIAALYRKLTQAQPEQRYLASTIVTMSANTSTYSLPANFYTLISVDLVANGHKTWLDAFEWHERPALTTPDTNASGTPCVYKLRAGNIEYLPTPDDDYTSTLWYVPDAPTLAADANTVDTIARLDEYIIWWGARVIAIQNKHWDLADRLTGYIGELEGDILTIGRSRDMNSPPRIVDVYQANRYGRVRRT